MNRLTRDQVADHAKTAALLALVLAVMVGAQWRQNHLDAQDEAEIAEAVKRDAELQARIDDRVQRAARALCAEQVGPGAVPRWITETSLTCLPPLAAPVARTSL